MAVAVLDKDSGWKRLLALARGKFPVVAIGVQGEEAEQTVDGNGEITMVVLAGVHEFGSTDGRIPVRSFIRNTVDSRRVEYAQLRKRLAALIVSGKLDHKRALGLLGEKVTSHIKGAMEAGLKPDLAPATIARRIQGQAEADGSRVFKPLIDTGQLKNSITYQVREG